MSKASKSEETKHTSSAHEAPEDQSEKIASEMQTAQLAYSYWEQRGCQGGSPEADWFRAVEELNNGQAWT